LVKEEKEDSYWLAGNEELQTLGIYIKIIGEVIHVPRVTT